MYLPSMLFGGSSILHLLASHPRVVALFGLGALMTTLLQSPWGRPDLPGTTGYVKQLDHVARMQGTIDPLVIERAQFFARALAESSSRSRLQEIVDETLNECGQGCFGIGTASVMDDPALLRDVLLIHELNNANARLARVPTRGAVRASDVSR